MTRPARGALLFLLGAGAGLAAAFAGTVLASKDPQSDALPWDDVRLLTEVLERVRQDYVEPVEDGPLLENAVRGMVTGLDPHSQFLDAEEYEEVRISTTGNYSGVGIEVNVRDGQVLVVAPIEGTPAARAGIRSGDVITKIDGVAVSGDNVTDAIMRLRGPAGTSVKLAVTRAGVAEPIDFELVRSNVQVHSVRARLLEPGLAYVRISQFSETTGADLRQALRDVQASQSGKPGKTGGKAAPLAGLVLDLRNNPGGVLDAAVEVSDDFLESGVIVTASGRGRDSNFRHEARAGDLVNGAPIVVLVDGGSASASEIVAGALQDNKRATIVGSQTFGKGSVQTVMPLSNGRAIKLTTSRYYTPSGASISGQGIRPDIVLARAAAPAAPAPPAAEAPDEALDKAVELLHGKRAAPAAVPATPPAATPPPAVD